MRKRFERRTIALFCILMAGIIGVMGSVYRIIGDEGIRRQRPGRALTAAPSLPFGGRCTTLICRR